MFKLLQAKKIFASSHNRKIWGFNKLKKSLKFFILSKNWKVIRLICFITLYEKMQDDLNSFF